MTPLPFLVQPTTGHAAHEIILVHGFKGPLEKRTQTAKCRKLLESWVLDSAKPIRDQVNVRIFAFDSAHILHHGHIALSEVVTELSKRFDATIEDPSSPLFRKKEEDTPSRAAVFVSHGIGAWIVKDLLHTISKSQHRIDPTGLIFLDVLDTPRSQTPLDLRADFFLLEYLRELSRIFKLDREEARIRDLRDKLSEVDHAFRKLTDARYGECESIDDDDVDSCTFNMKIWCENVWLSLQPTSESKKTLFQRLFICGRRSKANINKPKLDDLHLEEKLREAISMEGFNDPISSPNSGSEPSQRSSLVSSYHTCLDTISTEPTYDDEHDSFTSAEEKRVTSTGESSDGNHVHLHNDGDLNDYRTIVRYLARNLSTEDLAIQESNQITVADICHADNSSGEVELSDQPPKIDKGKGKAIALKRLSSITEESLQPHPKSQSTPEVPETPKTSSSDEFYNFDKAITTRDAAIHAKNEDATQLAHHHLALVHWHQELHLGKSHPTTLITQRECITTNLVLQTWCANPATYCEKKKHLFDAETQMRGVYQGLEEALGPSHRETLGTLAALLSVRVSLVQQGWISWEAMEVLFDMVRERWGEPEARTAERWVHTLRVKYKVGVSLARIWRYGEVVLEELLREVDDGLVRCVDWEVVEGLRRLRGEVGEKVDLLREQREEKNRKG